MIATVLVTILTSLITNIADFGDTSLKARLMEFQTHSTSIEILLDLRLQIFLRQLQIGLNVIMNHMMTVCIE